MFYSVRFSFRPDEPIKSYDTNHRFPFSMEAPIGESDTVSEIRVPKEFVNDEVKNQLRDGYQDSKIGGRVNLGMFRHF